MTMKEHASDVAVAVAASVLGLVGWLADVIKNPEVMAALLSLLGWTLKTAYNEFRLRRRDQALREREGRLGLSDGKDEGRDDEGAG